MGMTGEYTIKINGEDAFAFKNLITDEGLGVMLRAATQSGESAPVWHLGLKGPGDPSRQDSAASHGWQELTAYQGSTRLPVGITIDGLSGRAQGATFLVTGEMTVYGAFLASAPGRGSAQGKLLSVGDFPAMRVLYAGDRLEISYVFTVGRPS